ncbi:MAG: PAS domain S-box protein [Candidatus Acidiferrum sp.]|jgi:PAS domain S-box-containing protein
MDSDLSADPATDRRRQLWNLAELNSSFRAVILACLVATLCYLAAELGGALVIRTPQILWPLWPGCALLVAVLLVVPRRTWPILLPAGLAGFVLYDLQAGVPIQSTAWLILADTLEVLVAAWGVSYSLNGLPRLNSLKALAKYSFFTVILASLIVSSIGTLGLHGNRWTSWRISFLSEGLAFLTVTPTILGWVDRARSRTRMRVSRDYYLEASALFAALIATSYAIFRADGTGVSQALPYSLVPFLLWAALRFGSVGAATSATIVALLSIWGAVHGRGPFNETDPIDRVFSLQLFLLFASVPFMVLAVLVEERESAEDELREGAENLRLATEGRLRLATLVESSDDAIIGRNIDGIITDWNAGAQRLFGYSAGEVIGQSSAMLIPERLHEEERHILQRLRAGECIEHYETEELTKRGETIAVSLTISPVRDSAGRIVGALQTVRDITGRKRTEYNLRESEDRFRLLANTAPAMIWMSGPDKLYTFFNQSWLQFTGRSMEQELGDGWAAGVHPEDMERCLRTYFDAFDARVSFEMEYRLRRFDGDYRWIVDFGSPRFERDGTLCGYIGSCIDITERKTFEESLQSLTGRLISAHEEERARIARDLHDDFSQRLALLGIGLGQLWKTLPETEMGERAAVLEMLKRTREMSSDMHSLSHQLHSSKLEHVGLVPALKGLCQEIAQKYRISVQFTERECPPNIPKDVALCLFRVAQEALGNVVKHSGATDAQVELIRTASGIRLRISDTGKGFDPALQNPDAGIGLIGMNERLRLVGGKLTVRSEPKRGTEVLADVPLTASANKDQNLTQAAGR